MLAGARAGELEDARALLASARTRDRLVAIGMLAKIDSRASIDALAGVVLRSGREIDKLGKRLDKNDIAWEKAFDKAYNLDARGKYGTEAYRRARLRQRETEVSQDEALLEQANAALARSETLLASLDSSATGS